MKKLLFVLVALAIFQNWGKIERAFQPAREAEASQREVVLYATSWCGYCQKTRELLAEQGVAYVERDIERSAEGRSEHAALGGGGVPVLKVGDTVIHGYNREAILAALN